jgi:glycosyltransferase involved in cell wall biosynthesis
MTTSALSNSLLPKGEVRHNLHVVHGVLSLETGGIERLVVDLVKEGRRRGDRVSVVCLERTGKLAPQAEALGAEVHCLDKPYGRSSQTARRAADLLRDLQPDVLHTHQVGALWHLGQAARRLNLPVVHTEHSDHVAQTRGWFNKLKMRLRWRRSAPLAHRYCCVSEDVAKSVRRFGTVPRNKVDVVLNGIDLAAFDGDSPSCEVRKSLGIPPGALVLGTVGRLAEVKRQDLLIQAFAGLCRQPRYGNVWLLIVGDGDERPRLEALAKKLGAAERTIFAGYQPQPERLLRAMDLFVLTSRHEGLPLALLEAWAAGLAVVSSAVGAIPQTVVHGISGMLFPSGDVKSLTETLEMLLDAPWIVSNLGRCGQARVRNRYSLQRMADEYESRYLALVGDRVQSPLCDTAP